MYLYTINNSNPPTGQTKTQIFEAIQKQIEKTNQHYYSMSQIYYIPEIAKLIKERRLSKSSIKMQVFLMAKKGNLIVFDPQNSV